LNSAVRKVKRVDGKVYVTDSNGDETEFDSIVFACHGDEVLPILQDASPEEVKAFENIKFTHNRAVLHRDFNFMPTRKAAWASWNYLTAKEYCGTDLKKDVMSLTYWMNKLQNIDVDVHGQVFVTMNPLSEPDHSFAEFNYTHPFYDKHLIESQKLIRKLNSEAVGGSETFFAGAWMNYGFHEDGLTSGLVVAQLLGCLSPFDVVDSKVINRKRDQGIKSALYPIWVNLICL
jgi:uncharacterized protein